MDEVHLAYPQPLTFEWRLFHWLNYFTGGVTFLIAAFFYFPTLENYTAGAWIFTIGSATFFIADLSEWWLNNRVGCFLDRSYRKNYEIAVSRFMDPPDTWSGRWQRMETGLNFFLSTIGSFLYLIGSVLLIPSLNESIPADEIFIAASAAIVVAQSWKLFRQGCVNNTSSCADFSFRNYQRDIFAALVDLGAGLGGAGYLFGSTLFLPSIDVNDDVTVIGSVFFVFGGFFYFMSGVFMFWRYFQSNIFQPNNQYNEI